MKFHLNHDHANKTLAIPRAALQLSGLVETSDLTIHTENGCVLLLPEKLSVAQTLKTFQLLTAINAELLFRLAKGSALAHGTENDACDGCHWEKECFQDVLPLCMLAEVGIDPVEGDFECAVKDGTLVLRSGADTNDDGSTRIRSYPHIPMEISFVLNLLRCVSESHPPEIISSSH